MANYLSNVVSIVDKVENKISSEKYEECVFQTEYIELLLNMNEPESKKLAEDMRHLFDAAVKPFEHRNLGDVYAARQKVAESARKILKHEWDKLRKELKTKQDKEAKECL